MDKYKILFINFTTDIIIPIKLIDTLVYNIALPDNIFNNKHLKLYKSFYGNFNINDKYIYKLKNLLKSKNIDSTLISEYIILITHSIFDQISNVNYPNENKQIPRHNHGAGNHMRQLLFGIINLYTLFKNNPKIFLEILKIDNTTFHLTSQDLIKRFMALLISPLFKALTRINESGSFSSKLSSTIGGNNITCYQKILTNDNNEVKDTYGILHELSTNTIYIQSILTEYTYTGFIIYKILMNYILNPNNDDEKISSYIDVLALAGCYYYDKYDIDKPNIKRNTILNNKLHTFILLHSLINIAHYMDHCRGAYSAFFQTNKCKFYLDYTFSNDKDKQIYTKYIEGIVISTIYNTLDFKNKNLNTFECYKGKGHNTSLTYTVKNYGYSITPNINHINLHRNFDKLFEVVFNMLYKINSNNTTYDLGIIKLNINSNINPKLKINNNYNTININEIMEYLSSINN